MYWADAGKTVENLQWEKTRITSMGRYNHASAII